MEGRALRAKKSWQFRRVTMSMTQNGNDFEHNFHSAL